MTFIDTFILFYKFTLEFDDLKGHFIYRWGYDSQKHKDAVM